MTLFARKKPGDDGCVRDYVYVGDVVAANLLAAEAELDGAFNVGTGVGTHHPAGAGGHRGGFGQKRAQMSPRRPGPGDLERSVVDAGNCGGRAGARRCPLTKASAARWRGHLKERL